MGSEQRLQEEFAAPLAGISVVVQRSDVEAHALPDQSFLLFDRRSCTTIPVSESAGRIWKLCDGNHTIDQIVDDLASIYDAQRLQIDQDAREFLALLERHGFVER
jgi:Coenzyme PQQ synthesis protein D (PqqD)